MNAIWHSDVWVLDGVDCYKSFSAAYLNDHNFSLSFWRNPVALLNSDSPDTFYHWCSRSVHSTLTNSCSLSWHDRYLEQWARSPFLDGDDTWKAGQLWKSIPTWYHRAGALCRKFKCRCLWRLVRAHTSNASTCRVPQYMRRCPTCTSYCWAPQRGLNLSKIPCNL